MTTTCTLPPPGWRCSREIGHDGPCAATPNTSAAPPLPLPPVAEPVVAGPPSYGFRRAEEFDLELPSGSYVRLKKLHKNQMLRLNLLEILDGFTPELLAEIKNNDADKADEAVIKALTNPDQSDKIFGPVDRVVAAAVVCPTVVLDGPTTDTQAHIDDIEIEDKLMIFNAAFGEQLADLKSVRTEGQSEAGVRDLPESEDFRAATV